MVAAFDQSLRGRMVRTALARLLAELGTELVGLLASGSRFNGEPDLHSDLDLVGLISSPRAKRRTMVVEGVEVVVDLAPARAVLRRFERDRAEGSGASQHMWASGVAAYDPHGALHPLMEEGARQRSAGPKPVSDDERWRLRLVPARMLDDCEALVERDSGQAAYVLQYAVDRLLHAYCRARGQWTPKAKHAIRLLDAPDPAGAALFRRACDGALAERLAAAKALLEHCLAPLGGPMPREEWETPWYPV